MRRNQRTTRHLLLRCKPGLRAPNAGLRARNAREHRAHERGQAAVLVALGLFCTVVFTAMATNVGILVNDRIRMQNTADLTAYAGAFEQARALNRLTEINRRIIMVADDIRKHLTCKDLPTDPTEIVSLESDCDESGHRVFPALFCDRRLPQGILKVGQARIQLLQALFMAENLRAAQPVIRAARFTAQANFQGMMRPRHSTFYEWRPGSPTFRVGQPLVKVEPAYTRFTYAMWRWAGHCGCPVFKPFPIPNIKGCLDTYEETLETWFYKASPGPTLFMPVRVNGTPLKNFIDLESERGGYFGADAAPRAGALDDSIWAFAAAKPYGGNIGPRSDQNGERKRINFRILLASKSVNGYDYDSFENAGTWDKFVPQYRARMAGIQESMLTDDGSNQKLKPFDLMKIDLFRASKALRGKIEDYVLH